MTELRCKPPFPPPPVPGAARLLVGPGGITFDKLAAEI